MCRQVLTYIEKSLTRVSMCQQDRLFEKAYINSGIISVSSMREWISQTRCEII